MLESVNDELSVNLDGKNAKFHPKGLSTYLKLLLNGALFLKLLHPCKPCTPMYSTSLVQLELPNALVAPGCTMMNLVFLVLVTTRIQGG